MNPEDAVHGFHSHENRRTISLYQHDTDHNWPMDNALPTPIAEMDNFDCISNNSMDSNSNSNSYQQYQEFEHPKDTSLYPPTLTNKLHEHTNLLPSSTPGAYDARTPPLPDTRYGEAFMGKYSNYNQKLTNLHVWAIVFVKSLDHIARKFFEYFAFFLAYEYFGINSFYLFSWCIASIDFSAILAMFVLPLVITRSPKKIQMICQSIIGMSIIAMSFWKGFAGLFILRFAFGFCYSLLLSVWSSCIGAFIPHAKQASAVSKIELSWAIASFSFIIIAWIVDHSGVSIILYILGITGLACALLLGGIMPSTKLVFVEFDRENFCDMIKSMFTDVLFTDLASNVFLLCIGLVTFTNMMLTICLAPWFISDYELTLTEFGYTTIILGTAQLTSIIFSGQFRNKLGTGWSIVAGILVQLVMFILLLILNNNGILYSLYLSKINHDEHYTFPLLIILLFLCIHFIAAEFTFINATTAMMQIAPSRTSQTVAANCLRLVTSIARIIGAVVGVLIWYEGLFKSVVLVGTICLSIALGCGVLLMGFMLKESSVWTGIHLRDDDYQALSSVGSENDIGNLNRLNLSNDKKQKQNNNNYSNNKNRRSMRVRKNPLLTDSQSENDSNQSDEDDDDDDETYNDYDSLSDDQKSFVNEKLDIDAIMNDIDNYEHNPAHVNNLAVL